MFKLGLDCRRSTLTDLCLFLNIMLPQAWHIYRNKLISMTEVCDVTCIMYNVISSFLCQRWSQALKCLAKRSISGHIKKYSSNCHFTLVKFSFYFSKLFRYESPSLFSSGWCLNGNSSQQPWNLDDKSINLKKIIGELMSYFKHELVCCLI